MKNFGFTLAEVLIALGIIGVISAITIPSIMQHYQKQRTVNQLKKVYSTLSQAFEQSKMYNGEFENWDVSENSDPIEYVNKYWIPYLKVLKQCETYQDCGYGKSRPWIRLTGKVSGEDVTGTQYRHGIVLNDGTVLSFRIPATNNMNNSAKINIDINGAQKPNKNCRDYFWIEIYEGKLRPYNLDNIGTNSAGYTCFAKIVQDGWKIEKDYPW